MKTDHEDIEIYSTYRDIEYIVFANKNTGHRCGYIKIPKYSKYFGVKYDDIDLFPHGGLTFGEIEKEEHWIGFDCGHFGDEIDESFASKIILEAYKRMSGMLGVGHHVWRKNEVENECKEMINDLWEKDEQMKIEVAKKMKEILS